MGERAGTGQPTDDDLTALAAVLGTGVFEVVPRGMDGEVSDTAHAELGWMGEVARTTGRPLTFSGADPHRDRPVPAGPTRILAEPNGDFGHPLASFVHETFDNMFPLSDPIDWEPTADDTIAAEARRVGRQPQEVLYDLFVGGDGRTLVLFPFTNYFRFSLDDVYEMLSHPASVFGLGDAGAHCGMACDASSPTLMLEHWTRDRTRGPRIPLPTAIRVMTSETAALYGLHDRGVLAPGYRADLNVIDHEHVRVRLPEMIRDLPAGGQRLMQRASGYRAAVVGGVVTLADDEPTGATPGRLIRGAQPSPT